MDTHTVNLPNNYRSTNVPASDITAVMYVILLAFLVLILIFCIFVRVPYDTANTEIKNTFPIGQTIFLSDSGTLRKSVRLHSPESLLYPDTIHPYAFAGNLNISEINTDFSIPDIPRTQEKYPFIPDLSVISPEEHVFFAGDFVERNIPEINYPAFVTSAGVLTISPLVLTRSAERQLRQNPPFKPTVLRVIPDESGPVTMVVTTSGNIELDLVACRHLETYLNTESCPESLGNTAWMCRVVWSDSMFTDIAGKGTTEQ